MSKIILGIEITMLKSVKFALNSAKSRAFCNLALRYRKHVLVIYKFTCNYRSFTRVKREEKPWTPLLQRAKNHMGKGNKLIQPERRNALQALMTSLYVQSTLKRNLHIWNFTLY